MNDPCDRREISAFFSCCKIVKHISFRSKFYSFVLVVRIQRFFRAVKCKAYFISLKILLICACCKNIKWYYSVWFLFNLWLFNKNMTKWNEKCYVWAKYLIFAELASIYKIWISFQNMFSCVGTCQNWPSLYMTLTPDEG